MNKLEEAITKKVVTRQRRSATSNLLHVWEEKVNAALDKMAKATWENEPHISTEVQSLNGTNYCVVIWKIFPSSKRRRDFFAAALMIRLKEGSPTPHKIIVWSAAGTEVCPTTDEAMDSALAKAFREGPATNLDKLDFESEQFS